MEQNVNFNIRVQGIPYYIVAKPCHYNSELQYQVSINGGEDVFFAFDSELGRYSSKGNDSVTIPDGLELEIGSKLNSNSLKNIGI